MNTQVLERVDVSALEVRGSDMQALTLIEPERQVVPPATSHASAAMNPGELLRIAVERGADFAQLEKLMDLQDRFEKNEARKAFVSAMAAFKAEPLEIFKRKAVGYTTNDGDFVGYKHAELSDVTSVVAPAMSKHQLSYRWITEQSDGRINVTCCVTHALGHAESVSLSAPPDASGKKNTIQAIASTVTYLQRYTLLAITGLATTGQDDDGTGAGSESGGEQADDLLSGFQNAALDGEQALRKHYEKVNPSDKFWTQHGPSLKKAARIVDQKSTTKHTGGQQ